VLTFENVGKLCMFQPILWIQRYNMGMRFICMYVYIYIYKGRLCNSVWKDLFRFKYKSFCINMLCLFDEQGSLRNNGAAQTTLNTVGFTDVVAHAMKSNLLLCDMLCTSLCHNEPPCNTPCWRSKTTDLSISRPT